MCPGPTGLTTGVKKKLQHQSITRSASLNACITEQDTMRVLTLATKMAVATRGIAENHSTPPKKSVKQLTGDLKQDQLTNDSFYSELLTHGGLIIVKIFLTSVKQFKNF